MPAYRKIIEVPASVDFLHGTRRPQHVPPLSLKKSAYSHIWERLDRVRLYRTLLIKRNVFTASGTNALAKLYNRRGCGLVRVHVLPAGVLFLRVTENLRNGLPLRGKNLGGQIFRE